MFVKSLSRHTNSFLKSKKIILSSLRIFASTTAAPPRSPINSQGLGLTDIADIPRSINYR